jgi:DNA-directed RNA polymerase subunit RPC12/RpoP
MLKFKCPCCGKKVITFRDKMKINAATNTYCRECGGKINTPFWCTFLASLTGYCTAAYFVPLVHTLLEKLLLAIVLIMLLYLIFIFLFPLINRKKKKQM